MELTNKTLNKVAVGKNDLADLGFGKERKNKQQSRGNEHRPQRKTKTKSPPFTSALIRRKRSTLLFFACTAKSIVKP